VDAKDLLTLVFERSAAVQTFWNFYIVVTLGLLGFLASAQTACARSPVQAVLTVVFVGFAVSNLLALLEVNRQLSALATAADAKVGEGPLGQLKAERLLHPSPLWAIGAFHLLGDVIAGGAIWIIPRYLGEGAKAKKPPSA
jgi:hypothetical protein